jgi:hypothetical protein
MAPQVMKDRRRRVAFTFHATTGTDRRTFCGFPENSSWLNGTPILRYTGTQPTACWARKTPGRSDMPISQHRPNDIESAFLNDRRDYPPGWIGVIPETEADLYDLESTMLSRKHKVKETKLRY